MRPLIALPSRRTDSADTWRVPATALGRPYQEAIIRAGGAPIAVPPLFDDAEVDDAANDVMARVDALCLPGGPDVSPHWYGVEYQHPRLIKVCHEHDAIDLALARAAIAQQKPVLAICRGHQVLNVALGGTLLQHLPESNGHHEHRRTPGSFDGADHDVRLADASLAARAAGEVDHATKSHHHQGIAALGDGFVETGWSTLDELPEAIEDPQRRFALGVQWHPEADEGSPLIAALVEAAR